MAVFPKRNMGDLRNAIMWRALKVMFIGTMVMVVVVHAAKSKPSSISSSSSSSRSSSSSSSSAVTREETCTGPGPSAPCTVTSIRATDEELYKITEKIWKADANRFLYDDVQYDINYSRKGKFFTKVYTPASNVGTKVKKPVLNTGTKVKKPVLNAGTYKLMTDLFKNYNYKTEIQETCDQACLAKETAFIKEIFKTGPIQEAHKWLYSKDPTLKPDEIFKEKLHQYWFERYSRSNEPSGPKGSSGFEHTFVGEIDNSHSDPQEHRMMGFHNWVRMYKEEKENRLRKLKRLESCWPPAIEAMTFEWCPIYNERCYTKPRSSLFIRTSPEVEIALSTICLLTRPSPESPPGGPEIPPVYINCPIRLLDEEHTMRTIVKRIQRDDEIIDTISSTYPVC